MTMPIQQANTDGVSGNINLLLTVKPNADPGELPNSALIKKFGRRIAISVQFAPPDTISDWSDRLGNTRRYGFYLPMNPKAWAKPVCKAIHPPPFYLDPSPRRDFTVILHERVELKTAPMTFIVPVSYTLPPDFHWWVIPLEPTQQQEAGWVLGPVAGKLWHLVEHAKTEKPLRRQFRAIGTDNAGTPRSVKSDVKRTDRHCCRDYCPSRLPAAWSSPGVGKPVGACL